MPKAEDFVVAPAKCGKQKCSLTFKGKFVQFNLYGRIEEVKNYESRDELLLDIFLCLVRPESGAPICEKIDFGSIGSLHFTAAADSTVLQWQCTLTACDMYIWDPERLSEDVSVKACCPECRNKASGDGWAKNFRAVMDWDREVLLYAKRAQCNNVEKHASGKSVRFILTDDAVMRELPSHVQQMCPLSLTHKSGVCVGLRDTLVAALPLGISVSDFCNLRNEVRAAGHVRAGLSYYNTVAGLKKHKPGRQLSLSESLTGKRMAAQELEPFPALNSAQYDSSRLLPHYAVHHLLDAATPVCEAHTDHMRTLGSTIFRMDAGHKNAKEL